MTEKIKKDAVVILVASDENAWAINDLFFKNLRREVEETAYIVFVRPELVWAPFEAGDGPDVIFLPEDQINFLKDIKNSVRNSHTKIVVIQQGRKGRESDFFKQEEDLYYLKVPVYFSEIKEIMKKLEVKDF